MFGAALVAVFATAVAAKLRGFAAFRASVVQFGVPRRGAPVVAGIVIAAETAGVALIAAGAHRPGAALLAALVLAFAALALARRHDGISCLCLPTSGAVALGPWTAARNVALAAAALAIIAGDVRGTTAIATLVGGLALAATVLLADALHAARAPVAAHPEPSTELEAPAPEVIGRDVRADVLLHLADLRGRSVLVLFLSTRCPRCDEVSAGLAAVRDEIRAPLVVVVTGTVEQARDYAEARSLPGMVLSDDESGASRAFGVGHAPHLLVLDGGGHVAEAHDPGTAEEVAAVARTVTPTLELVPA